MPRSPTDWTPRRPNVLVVACSDGRLQQATDGFLAATLRVASYDRFYVPGGGGALVSSGRDFIRAQQLRRECRYLVELHGIERVVVLVHGPAPDGPAEAVCADYRRKLPFASPLAVRDRQRLDVAELLDRRAEWAAEAEVTCWRAEVGADGGIRFVALDPDAS